MAAEREPRARRVPRGVSFAAQYRSQHRSAHHASRAVLVLASALMITGTGGAGAAAQPAAQHESAMGAAVGTTTAPGDAEPSIALLAAPAASGIARPGEPLSVRVTITNLGDEPTPELEVTLAVAGSSPAEPAQVASWFDGASVDLETRTVTSATVSRLEPDASAVLDLIAPDAARIIAGAFGARVALVTASAGDALIAVDRTAVVWVPDAAAPPSSRTVFLAPISTPGVAGGLLDAGQLERLTAEAGALTRQLDAVAGRPVLVAIDPRVLASIRLLGDQAPPSSLVFLDRLSAMPNETILLPWADADPLVALAAGTAPLAPEGAGSATQQTESGAASDDPEPSPQPRDLSEASAWPATIDSAVWASEGVTVETLDGLKDAGARLIVVPSSALASRDAVQRLDDVVLLRADDALSSAARSASTAPSQQRFDRAIARMSALLAAEAAMPQGAPVVIALDRDRLPSSERLVDTIARTISLPWATAGTASDALALTPPVTTVSGDPVDPERVAAARRALDAEAADRAFATIATDPASITDLRRLELLSAMSLGWGEQSIDALDAFVDASTELRSAVRVAESSTILLLADRASLPVTVQNDLDVAVRVFVRVDPDTTQLRVLDPRVEVVVEPRSQTRALVPVESLTNGQVDITVTLRDEGGAGIGEATRVSLNLQAGWETAGTIAIAGAVLLLLGIGITRDIRKRRRQKESSR